MISSRKSRDQDFVQLEQSGPQGVSKPFFSSYAHMQKLAYKGVTPCRSRHPSRVKFFFGSSQNTQTAKMKHSVKNVIKTFMVVLAFLLLYCSEAEGGLVPQGDAARRMVAKTNSQTDIGAQHGRVWSAVSISLRRATCCIDCRKYCVCCYA